MAAAGMTSFDTLSDEMALKIIKMAATPKSQSQTLITMAANKKLGDGEMLVKRWEDKVLRLLEDDTEEVGSWSLKYDHDFLVDVLSKVSLRFRRVARDSSLWKDYVRIYNPLNDISKLNFVIRECLNYGTKTLTVIWEYPISDPSVTLRYGDIRDISPTNTSLIWLQCSPAWREWICFILKRTFLLLGSSKETIRHRHSKW